jgi:hypothetical protein
MLLRSDYLAKAHEISVKQSDQLFDMNVVCKAWFEFIEEITCEQTAGH